MNRRGGMKLKKTFWEQIQEKQEKYINVKAKERTKNVAKCNVCGRYFRLLAKNRYEVVELPIGLNCLTQSTERYNAFDCPHCGCQNVYGTKIKKKIKSISKQENIENFSDKLNAIYQTIAEY